MNNLEQRINDFMQRNGIPEDAVKYQWRNNKKILPLLADCPYKDAAKRTDWLFEKFHNLIHREILNTIILIVSDWGGIHYKDSNTLSGYAELLKNSKGANLQEQFSSRDGIASWSKILAAWDPEHFFIYDSRVALALQLIYGREYKLDIPASQSKKTQQLAKEVRKQAGRRKIDFKYPQYCEKLLETRSPKEIEKKLFMLGGWLRDQNEKIYKKIIQREMAK